jgi:hypothetical protein
VKKYLSINPFIAVSNVIPKELDKLAMLLESTKPGSTFIGLSDIAQ